MNHIYEVRLATNVTPFSIVELPKLELDASGETFIPDHVFHIASDVDLTGSAVTERATDMRVLDGDDFKLFELIFTDLTDEDYRILTNDSVFHSWYAETLNESWIRPVDYDDADVCHED